MTGNATIPKPLGPLHLALILERPMGRGKNKNKETLHCQFK